MGIRLPLLHAKMVMLLVDKCEEFFVQITDR